MSDLCPKCNRKLLTNKTNKTYCQTKKCGYKKDCQPEFKKRLSPETSYCEIDKDKLKRDNIPLPDTYPIYYGYLYYADKRPFNNTVCLGGYVSDLKRCLRDLGYTIDNIYKCDIGY